MIIKIAIDVMGGDNAPNIPLKACDNFIKNNPQNEVRFNLFGQQAQISKIINNLSHLKKNSDIFHCSEVISNNNRALELLRSFPDSSMKNAINSIKKGISDCFISAGNTTAIMLMGKVILNNIAGIHRPSIISNFPTLKDDFFLLDLGANLECNAETLVEFAVLGSAYFYSINTEIIRKPRLALLNVGTEVNKGNNEIKKAYNILNNILKDQIEFCGYIEPTSFFEGNVDVIIADGFSGNVFLKTAESVSNLIFDQLKKTFGKNILTKTGALLVKNELKRSMRKFNTANANAGGPLLGINGIILKTRGDSDERIYENTIRNAYKLTSNKMLDKISELTNIFQNEYQNYKNNINF